MIVKPHQEAGPANRIRQQLLMTWLPMLSAGFGLLIIILFLFSQPGYLQLNLLQAGDFIWSFNFLFLLVAGVLFNWRGGTELRYDILIIGLTALYLSIFYEEFLSPLHMSGDSVCQLAYWKIFWNPEMQGSVGVSFTKPGQVFFLGMLSQLVLFAGNWAGPYLFKGGLILVMTFCVWSLVRVATDLAGRVAGFLAFLFTIWAFLGDFIYAESTIYFIAVLFIGLRLYYLHPRYRRWGRLLLAASILFRIEAVAVLGAIWLSHAIRKEWRELWLLSCYSLISLLICILVIFQIQGSFARLNSGAAVGYVSPIVDGDRLGYLGRTVVEEFTGKSWICFLLALTSFGLAGTAVFRGRIYLFVFASLIAIFLNVLVLGGSFNMGRYLALVYAFACSVGAAALVTFVRELFSRKSLPASLSGAAFILFLVLTFNYGIMNTNKYLDQMVDEQFLTSAVNILQDDELPQGVGLLSEDDLLAYIVVLAPENFRKLASLQLFNVSDEIQRKEILADTDYIWIELGRLSANYYYYLYYLDDPDWVFDPFRLMIFDMYQKGQPLNLYGYRFIPLSVNKDRLLVKVEREIDGD